MQSDLIALSMAFIITSIQVQIRSSNSTSYSKAHIGWEREEQAGSRPWEMIAELG